MLFQLFLTLTVQLKKVMFGIFKKKSKKEQLSEQYKKLSTEAHRLSTTNRKASDLKQAEAQEILKQLEALEQKE